jgi:hypothetical protein
MRRVSFHVTGSMTLTLASSELSTKIGLPAVAAGTAKTIQPAKANEKKWIKDTKITLKKNLNPV